MTSSYNATSLQQVIAAYYQDYTIADVGRNRDDYVPRRGFPGTLAPGEKFKDNYAIDDLERRVLHPWPAMQQFRWHVRMPTTHPMISPPLLWLAQNRMYTSNFTESQLAEGGDEIVGGTYMTPRDALRIAKITDLEHPMRSQSKYHMVVVYFQEVTKFLTTIRTMGPRFLWKRVPHPFPMSSCL